MGSEETDTPITPRQLEDHLWRAADLFRNKVSNRKDYILAPLFGSLDDDGMPAVVLHGGACLAEPVSPETRS